MFGRKKKQQISNEEKERIAKEQMAEKAKKDHDELAERYYKAREYDQRVAAGENPDTVYEDVYGAHEVTEMTEEPVQEEAPVEEPVQEDEVLEEEPAEEVVENEEVVEADEEVVEADEEVVEADEEVVEADEEVAEADEEAVEANEEVVEVDEEETEADEEVVEEEEDKEEALEPVQEEPKAKKTPAKKTPSKKAPAKKAPAKKASKKEAQDDTKEKVLVEADKNDKTGGKYEIFQDADGYKYRLLASNGQVMANSEVYTTVKGAQKGIETLKANLDTLVTHIETDKHRKSQFIGCTTQNKVLIHSANYSSKASAESAVETVKALAHATKVVLVEEDGGSKPEVVDRSKFLKEAGKGKFVILFNKDTLTYQFALKASNGQTIVTSKFYKSDVSCKSAITKFREEVKTGTFYTVEDKNGQYQFRLYSQANKLVQSGISYSTKTKCLSNIESICRFIDSDLVE